MSFVNIHGQPLDMQALVAKAPAYRKLNGTGPKRKPTEPLGYAAVPGSGPADKTCRDCKHKHSMSNTGGNSWIKCELMRAAWTHGRGTDILASSPACRRFEPK